MRLGKLFYLFIAMLTAYLAGLTEAMAGTNDINQATANVIDNSLNLPGLVSVAAYLTGLAVGVKAVLDFVKHTTAGPREMPLRTPIIETVVAGLLLALPFTYEVLLHTIQESAGGFTIAGWTFYQDTGLGGKNIYYMGGGGGITSWVNPSDACATALYRGGLGGIFCQLWETSSSLPGLLSGFAYIAGLAMIYFATIALKESVEDPNKTSLWVPLQRYTIAALLLALPWTLQVLVNTLTEGILAQSNTDFDVHAATTAGGLTLDGIVGNFVYSIYGAMDFVIAGFCYIAGLVLILIGIFRMMKTMQDGPRGPGGIGTIMTFITGAALISIGPTMGAFATSLFGDNVAETNVDLTIPGGGLVDYEERLENFISAVLAYMIILGTVSFVRGLFIFRSVAEGDQQASMMSAVTHLLGGALLVNLGPFLTAVQTTLGPVSGLPGLTFS